MRDGGSRAHRDGDGGADGGTAALHAVAEEGGYCSLRLCLNKRLVAKSSDWQKTTTEK